MRKKKIEFLEILEFQLINLINYLFQIGMKIIQLKYLNQMEN